MAVKTALGWIFKTLALTLVFLIVFMAGGALFPIPTPPLPANQMPAVYLGLLITAAVNAAVIALVVGWSGRGPGFSGRGWKLVLALGVAYYGVRTVMTQIETYYFAPAMAGIDRAIIPPLLARDLLVTVVFVPLAVIILGRMRPEPGIEPEKHPLISPAQWAWKLAIIAIVYLVLYFGFGFIVAWQNPALQTMYGSGANQDVFAPSRLIPLQIGRGILWALFALPVTRLLRARPWLSAVALGLFIALPMNITHVIPNTVMPDPSVRLSHFIETATSNFLFGLVIYWLLHRRHTSLADLFGGQKEEPAPRIAHA